ncbi:MAG: BPSS1780 family membrane protein [Burkholderiales bacterium]
MPRRVSIGHGLQWISSGWGFFKRNPLGWILLMGTLLAIWVLLLSIPMLGPLLFNLLFPVFFAGLMLGCRAMEQGGKLEFGYLFAGFRENAAALVSVGGVYLVGMLLVIAIVTSSGGLPRLPDEPKPEDVATLQNELRNMRGPILAGMALLVPLLMLTWFAPLLIVFRRMTVLPALKESLSAIVRNLGAFVLYGVAIFFLWLVATLPIAGSVRNPLIDVLTIVALVVVLSIIFGSIYASYMDIFEPPSNNPP